MRFLTLATVAAALAAAAPAPAFAQPLDELTIYGRHRNVEPQTLSERVSYADLDLAYSADRAMLLRRVNYAARRVCDQLNEPGPSAANLGRSCQDIAIHDAMYQVRDAFADARRQMAYDGD